MHQKKYVMWFIAWLLIFLPLGAWYVLYSNADTIIKSIKPFYADPLKIVFTMNKRPVRGEAAGYTIYEIDPQGNMPSAVYVAVNRKLRGENELKVLENRIIGQYQIDNQAGKSGGAYHSDLPMSGDVIIQGHFTEQGKNVAAGMPFIITILCLIMYWPISGAIHKLRR